VTATPSVDAHRSTRAGVLSTGVAVLASRGRLAGLVVTAAVVTLAYTILLPFDITQRFSLANWHYLNASLIAWSVALGLGMAYVFVVQVHAIRQIATRRSSVTVGGVAFLGSLLPSLLCCSPVLPTLFAFVGLSTAQLYGTTGAWQYFFAVHQTAFLAGSLVVLAVTAWWGLRRIANSTCAGDQGCATPDTDRRQP